MVRTGYSEQILVRKYRINLGVWNWDTIQLEPYRQWIFLQFQLFCRVPDFVPNQLKFANPDTREMRISKNIQYVNDNWL